MTKRKIIGITGGSGHLGTGLIIDCLNKGYLLKASYRNHLPSLSHKNLEWFQGDINDPQHLEEAFKKVDVLVHCAGLISMARQPDPRLFDVNVGGTKSIIGLCIRHKIKLVHISSSTAIKEPDPNLIFNEKGTYREEQDFYYGFTKAQGEIAILKHIEENTLDAIILRPTSIIGPPDYRPSMFGRTLLQFWRSKLQIVTTGGHHLIDLRDLNNTIINSFTKAMKGEIYLLGGPYTTLKEIAKICNPKAYTIVIPLSLLIFVAPLIDKINSMLNIQTAFTLNSLKLIKHAAKHIDYSKAQTELNHQNRDTKETITDFLNWFKNEAQ